MSTSASENATYSHGDIISQHWSGVFFFFAFFTAFIASYSAVRLLDHTLWRSEKEKEYASVIIIKYPQVAAACLLGFGTVWSMHFVGMAAVTLDRTTMCYDWPMTLASLVAAVFSMWVGVAIASRDVFRGPDRLKLLREIVVKRPSVTTKGRHKEANRIIHRVAFGYKPWYIVTGGTSAATGALIMHYIGMMAIKGPFQMRWSFPFVAASVFLGVVVCWAGFWIIFRLLRWKVEQFWLRPASAAVIAAAVCLLNFIGILGVTYEYDDSLVGVCGAVGKYKMNPETWTPHQTLALAVALGVPSLALLIENCISRELIRAYSNLKDPRLTLDVTIQDRSQLPKSSFWVAGEALSVMEEGIQSTADIESPSLIIQATTSKRSITSGVGVTEGSENSELTQLKGLERGQQVSFQVTGKALSVLEDDSKGTAEIESPSVRILVGKKLSVQ